MLQLHLSDQQKFIVYYGESYIKDFMVMYIVPNEL